MKNIKMKLITWIGLFAVCLLPVGARAAQHFQSGIIGVVGETNTWNTIRVFDGRKPILVPIDADGFFEVDLKPGKYVLTPLFIPVASPVWDPIFPSYGTPIPVVVAAHHFTLVEIGVQLSHGPLPVPPH
jgi:hypothetical protein